MAGTSGGGGAGAVLTRPGSRRGQTVARDRGFERGHAAAARNPQVGREFGQRIQYERALVQARVRQLQAVALVHESGDAACQRPVENHVLIHRAKHDHPHLRVLARRAFNPLDRIAVRQIQIDDGGVDGK